MFSQVRTIADIARLAGVSKSTVSRALNDSPLISEKTKARIHAIAQAYNFTAHQGARNLSLRRNHTFAFVFPIEPEAGQVLATDPFVLQMLGAIAHTLTKYDYDLLVAQTRIEDQDWVKRYLDSKRVDGLIIFSYQGYSRDIAKLAIRQAPFIVWGASPLEKTFCSVCSDDVAGGFLATQHLIRLGRKRIAFLGGTQGEGEFSRRYQGYKRALKEAGYTPDASLAVSADCTSQSGYEAMKRLLKLSPAIDAVVIGSDVMAIAAMEALREAGRHVPEDVSVIGYDDIPIAAYCSPPLTTIRQDISKAGKLLVRNLMQYLDDQAVTNAILPVELIVRKSSGA